MEQNLEQQNNEEVSEMQAGGFAARHRELFCITPLSKYLAMIFMLILPFLGGYVGYVYAPEKVVEVEKVVVQENKDDTEYLVPNVESLITLTENFIEDKYIQIFYSYKVGKFTGFYQSAEVSIQEAGYDGSGDGLVTCDFFTITDGPTEILTKFGDDQRMTHTESPLSQNSIYIDLASLNAEEKEILLNTSEENTVSVLISDYTVDADRGYATCEQFIDSFKIYR